MKKETKDKIKKLIIEKGIPALEKLAEKEVEKQINKKGSK